MLSKNISFIWFLGGPKFDLMTSLWRHLANLHKFLHSFEKTIRSNLSMPNFKNDLIIGAGRRICPLHVCVIQKTPCGTGLNQNMETACLLQVNYSTWLNICCIRKIILWKGTWQFITDRGENCGMVNCNNLFASTSLLQLFPQLYCLFTFLPTWDFS